MAFDRPTPATASGGRVTLARVDVARRRIEPRRAGAVLAAIVIAGAVATVVGRARNTVASLGPTERVVIATVDIDPGTTLDSSNTVAAARPVGHVPASALPVSSIESGDIIAAGPLSVGEIVLSPRVLGASTGDSSDGRAGDGRGLDDRIVTVPMPLAPPPLAPGDIVELVGVMVADEPFPASAQVLAVGRVEAFDDRSVAVATSRTGALAVVTHLGAGAIEIIVTPLVDDPGW